MLPVGRKLCRQVSDNGLKKELEGRHRLELSLGERDGVYRGPGRRHARTGTRQFLAFLPPPTRRTTRLSISDPQNNNSIFKVNIRTTRAPLEDPAIGQACPVRKSYRKLYVLSFALS
jgi:hypothetical protein